MFNLRWVESRSVFYSSPPFLSIQPHVTTRLSNVHSAERDLLRSFPSPIPRAQCQEEAEL